MPIDRKAWAEQLHLSNFVNASYQYRDVQSLPDVRSILVIGPGQGLDTAVFRWRGYDVTTFDIDDTFRPDVVGSCHEMRMFADRQFDVVIASHVLEHLPVSFLDPAVAELSRVAGHALVYLPVAGRAVDFRFRPGVLGIDLSVVLDMVPFWRRPDGVTPRYSAGQHYWELGMRGFRKRDVLERFARHFDVIDAYRNREWLPSYNFVLRSRQHAGRA
jgi:hypothetical protein